MARYGIKIFFCTDQPAQGISFNIRGVTRSCVESKEYKDMRMLNQERLAITAKLSPISILKGIQL